MPTTDRRRAAIVSALVAAGVCATGVAIASQAQFTSKTELVTVDATVLDQNGVPAPGLVPEDFEVEINGRKQPVQTVAFLRVDAGEPGPPAGVSPSPPSAGTRASRLFVLMFDDLSVVAGEGRSLLVAAEQFVRALPPTDLVGYTTTGGTAVVNPTFDRDPIVKALRGAVGNGWDPRRASGGEVNVGLVESLDIGRGRRDVLAQAIIRECYGGNSATVERLGLDRVLATVLCARQVDSLARTTAAHAATGARQQVFATAATMRAIGVVGGIKHLVLLTHGIASDRDGTDLVPIAVAASQAGVQLTVLRENQDAVDLMKRLPTAAQVSRMDDVELSSLSRLLADMSGGEFYNVIGDGNRFFDYILSATSGIYRLGVALPTGLQAGKDLQVRVRVKRSGLTVRASHRALVPATAEAMTVEDRLRTILKTGDVVTTVRVQVGTAVTSAGDGQFSLIVRTVLGDLAPGPITAAIGVIDSDGALRTALKTETPSASETQVRYFDYRMPIAPGRYIVRVAITDAKGASGSAETRVITPGAK
jgi:VWFA-related protein